ncbi:MAG: (d)CMP kinase [Candidatus Moraniibacteriota bacterium]|nr:MAG: (d)CMP kinase [Candidatus Moranbacteria bacterium]
MAKISLEKLLSEKEAKVGDTIFIAVDGHGGSGKSTFAKWLSEELDAQIIQTDDFASWDNPLNWWPLVIEKVFDPIKKGARTLSYPRSSWWENHHPEPVIDQPVTKIMILEGVSSLRKEFRNYISLGFFVDTPLFAKRSRERFWHWENSAGARGNVE